MRLGLVLVFVLVLVRPALAEDEPRSMPLWKAAREGLVEVTGRSVFEFRVTQVTIVNRSKEKLRLSVLGSYFEPDALDVTHTRSAATPAVTTRDWVQAIGLGLLRRGEPTAEVVLAAAGRTETRVASFCLERPADPPDEKTPLHFVTEPMPANLLAILERWRADPSKRQEEVQDEIWNAGFARREAGPAALPRGAKRVVFAGGHVYALAGEVLWKGIPGERVFPFAYPVVDVASTGAELFGVFRVSPNPKTKAPGTYVARYAGHSRWVEEVSVPEESVARLEWSHNGAILATDAKGALRAVLRKETLDFGRDARLALGPESALVVARDSGTSTITRLAPRCLRLNATQQTVAAVVSSAALVDDKVFAVTERGELLELDGAKKPVRRESPKQLGGKRTCRAVHAWQHGAVVETDEGLVLVEAAGDPIVLPRPPKGASLAAGAGRLYAVRDGEALELSSDRVWRPIRFRTD